MTAELISCGGRPVWRSASGKEPWHILRVTCQWLFVSKEGTNENKMAKIWTNELVAFANVAIHASCFSCHSPCSLCIAEHMKWCVICRRTSIWWNWEHLLTEGVYLWREHVHSAHAANFLLQFGAVLPQISQTASHLEQSLATHQILGNISILSDFSGDWLYYWTMLLAAASPKLLAWIAPCWSTASEDAA